MDRSWLSITSMKPSNNASSQAECRGQVVRQASMASAYVLGLLEIQDSNSRTGGLATFHLT
jgi:hypothetical protein